MSRKEEDRGGDLCCSFCGKHQSEVKKLIASFGVEKLSAIDSDLYGELLAKAEAL